MSVNTLFEMLVKIIITALIGCALLLIAGLLLGLGPVGWIALAIMVWAVYSTYKERKEEGQ